MNTWQPGRSRGFTLIELMIVVVVIGILAAVAYPSYQSSVRKARRSDATDGAVAVLQAQERWRANVPSYYSGLLESTTGLRVNSTTAGGFYTMTLSTVSGTGYTLSFAPVLARGQGSDSGCTGMTVTVVSGSPTYAPAACWSR